MRSITKLVMECLLAVALIVGVPRSADAGIQGYLYAYNRTGKIVEVQVNGKWRGVLDPGATGTYNIGDSADKTTQLYAEDASTGEYWVKDVTGPWQDYDWYIQY